MNSKVGILTLFDNVMLDLQRPKVKAKSIKVGILHSSLHESSFLLKVLLNVDAADATS